MISYQTANCSFTFYLRYSFTHNKFWDIFMHLSSPTGGIHIHKNESNASMLSRIIFILKVSTFFFCSVYLRNIHDQLLSKSHFSTQSDMTHRFEHVHCWFCCRVAYILLEAQTSFLITCMAHFSGKQYMMIICCMKCSNKFLLYVAIKLRSGI